MSRFLSSGFTDSFRFLHPDSQEYTWWSFRFNARANNKGWRIDYCMVSDCMRQRLLDASILPHVKHSDHCPAVLVIK